MSDASPERALRIRITPGVATDYETRDVFPELRNPGSFDVDVQTARNVLADADYHGDASQFAPECRSLCRSYRNLAFDIRANLLGGHDG